MTSCCSVLLLLLIAYDGIASSPPTPREIELAQLQLAGMKDSRDCLRSGVFARQEECIEKAVWVHRAAASLASFFAHLTSEPTCIVLIGISPECFAILTCPDKPELTEQEARTFEGPNTVSIGALNNPTKFSAGPQILIRPFMRSPSMCSRWDWHTPQRCSVM